MAPQLREAIRSMIQNVDVHVGGMRYAQGMQEATRLSPADSEDLRVRIDHYGMSAVLTLFVHSSSKIS